jgi:hypothetical protein
LIIRPGAIGDFLVALPAMECLAAGCSTEVWVRRPNVPLARFAGRARAIEDTGLDRLGIVEPPAGLVETLGKFTSVVSWYGANRPEFRELVRSLGLPFTFFPALPEGAETPAADFYLAHARTLGECPGDGVPRIACPAARGDFAVLHPFASGAGKRWPMDRFEELARLLAPGLEVRWCAGPEDDLAGATRIDDLYELACWLAGARVYIGNDSGITHLAAAAGTPVVALFGPTDPLVWAPRGPRVRVLAKPAIASIEVREVMDAIAVALQ